MTAVDPLSCGATKLVPPQPPSTSGCPASAKDGA